MANQDISHKKVNYSDGEGLEDADLNRQQHEVDAAAIEKYGIVTGGLLGNAFNMGQRVGGQGGAIVGSAGTPPNIGAIPNNVLLDPYPMMSPFKDIDPAGDMFIQTGILGQRHNNNMPGTRPTGSADQIFALLDDEGGSPALNVQPFFAANLAPGAGNPRWDIYAMRLGYGTDGATTRDFKDAITGALSTTTPDKDHVINIEEEYIVGGQAATYDPSTALAGMTAGFVPALVIRRSVGSGSTVVADDLHYLGVPMRLGVEDVMGYEGFWSRSAGTPYDTTSVFAPSDNNDFAAEFQAPSGAATLRFVPRTMPQSARLIGVAVIGTGFDQDQEVSLMRFDWTTLGVFSATKLANLDDASSSGRLSAEAGYFYVSGIGSDPDWAIVGGARFPTPGLPLWGNGRTYGPCFRDNAGLGAQTFSKLGVQIEEEGANTYDAGDKIYMVRFVYLY